MEKITKESVYRDLDNIHRELFRILETKYIRLFTNECFLNEDGKLKPEAYEVDERGRRSEKEGVYKLPNWEFSLMAYEFSKCANHLEKIKESVLHQELRIVEDC